MRQKCLVLALFPFLAAAQAPVIESGGVQNAASKMPLTSVAPQMLITIVGQNLATKTEIAEGMPWPKALGGATVTFNGQPAPLLYASPTQINVQAPSSLWSSTTVTTQAPAEIVVTTANGSSVPQQFPVSMPSLGVFTLDMSGCGQAVAFNVHADGSIALNTPQNSLDPEKDWGLTFFLTGLMYFSDRVDGQPWTYNPADNLEPLNAESDFFVAFGYPELTGFAGLGPQYIGPAPGTAGVDQINAAVERSGVPQGCHVPMYVRSSYNSSQLVDVSIQPGGGQCVDPPADTLGTISWQQTTVSDTSGKKTSAAISAQFIQSNGLGFPTPVGLQAGEINVGDPLFPSPAACVESLPSFLDAGALTLSGPGLSSATMTPSNANAAGTYSVAPPGGVIQGGTYQVSGSGGSQVGPFNASAKIPAPIQITGDLQPGATIAPDSNGNYTFTWTGGADTDIVTVQIERVSESTSASAGSISIPNTPIGSCFITCLPPIYPGTGQEVIFTQGPPLSFSSANQSLSIPFSAPGLGMGGEMTWKYVFDFRDLTVK